MILVIRFSLTLKMRLMQCLAFVLLFGCTKTGKINHKSGFHSLGVPKLETIKYPDGRPPSTREIELGKALFFDKRLSINNSVACATCHNPAKGFSDGSTFSKGAAGKTLTRHTPHLYNVAWNSHFFWDGRAKSLEEQVLAVIKSPSEMNMPLNILVSRLEKIDYYKNSFEKVFPKTGLSPKNIAKAISAFERTIVSNNSPFVRYMQGDKTALSEKEIRGFELFVGKANCIKCHNGPNLTDGDFHNTGLTSDDIGRQEFDRLSVKREFEMSPYHFLATLGAFKTPSLHNVALSAPYMHNGSEKTLEDVVRFYNQGGKNPDKKRLARAIRPLHLKENEIFNLVAFLKSLTSKVEVKPPKFHKKTLMTKTYQ